MRHVETTDFRSLQDFGSLPSRPPIRIVPQDRRTLAMRVTPSGIQVLIPQELDADSPRVQSFIAAGLQKLPQPEPIAPTAHLSPEDICHQVSVWSRRLGAEIKRTQIRTMRTKWASCSGKGTLTLSTDVLQLPSDLVDYIICHELVHRRIPDHGKGFQAMMACHIPDWRERVRRLAGWMLLAKSTTEIQESTERTTS